MAATAARRTAFDLLLRIERDAAFADELLHSERLNELDPRGRALVTELVMGCLRWRGELDFLVCQKLHKPLQVLDSEVLAALRLGAYQLRHMRRVPIHAAVSESVELVKASGRRSASGMVNAVLRRLPQAPPPEQAARLSHPAWLVERWEAAFGARVCRALLAANLRRPRTYLRIPVHPNSGQTLQRLAQAGIEAVPAGLPRAYRVQSGRAGSAAVLAPGELVIQDLNSQRVAALLEVRPASRVLDVCAAPGGKARLLAETAPVVAGDRHLHRLRTMRGLGCQGMHLLVLDAERPLPFSQHFDRILVDAPCSGTGTLARNPEIKWRLDAADLKDLQARQVRILRHALEVLAPGGRLVYSTCSLEPEENEHVVDATIRCEAGWTARQVLSTVPGRDPGDGFQAWRFQRRAA